MWHDFLALLPTDPTWSTKISPHHFFLWKKHMKGCYVALCTSYLVLLLHFLPRVHHETFSTPCGGLCQAVYKVVKTVKTWIVNAAQYECKLRYTLTKFIGVMTARDLVGPLVGFLRVSLYAEFLSESTVRRKEFFILIQELKLSTMCKQWQHFLLRALSQVPKIWAL